jgi:radical SAM superfamily enzyme YgiQ (UPF0313 family)
VSWDSDSLFFSTPPLYLNSFLRVNYPDIAEKIVWQKMQFNTLSQKDLIAELNMYQSNILCVTSYIWNNSLILNSLTGLKEKLGRDITIIMGGPSTDVVRNKTFLQQNPDLDFAVYSQGEQAFADILQHLLGIKKLSLLNSRNVSWRDNNKIKVADFQFYKLEKISPYLISKDLIELVLNDPDYAGKDFVLPYETSRGCPYNCSFCDWTSGLTHKTYFRKFDIEEEIDTLGRLGITNIHLSDANFGQHKQDIEIAKTFARLRKEKNYNFRIEKTNFSKLLKDRVFEIVDILIEGGLLHNIKFAVQDINEKILENIERPDIPYDQHKVYIDKVSVKYPHVDIGIELIQGLPGQTRESWEDNLIKTAPYKPVIYFWNILPNSPAGYDQEYRQRMKIGTHHCNLIDYTQETDDNTMVKSMEFVTSTYSYSFEDYCYFTLLSKIFTLPVLRTANELLERKVVIELVKHCTKLNDTVNAIKNSIETNREFEINHIVETFMKLMIKENKEKLPKNYIKSILVGLRP